MSADIGTPLALHLDRRSLQGGQMQKRGYSGRLSTGTVIVGLTALVVVSGANRAPVLAAPAAAIDDGWDTFGADVSIQQALVAPSGAVVLTPPAVAMRLERSRIATGWRTRVTLQEVQKALARTAAGTTALDNPFLVTRLEYDGDGTLARFFNREGQRVVPPGSRERSVIDLPAAVVSAANLPIVDLANPAIVRGGTRSPAPDWLENVVATPGERQARRAALEGRYGSMRGRVNGMDQYVSTAGNTTCEVLVASDAVVPVEINVARDSALVGRSTFTHDRRPDGVAIRRLLHAERVSATGRGRLVTDVALANVTLTKAGAR